MRLIDADALKKGLSEKTRTSNEASRFIDILDEQPTAYDVEKVVEQLKSLKVKYISGWNIIDDAIKIVKGGAE